MRRAMCLQAWPVVSSLLVAVIALGCKSKPTTNQTEPQWVSTQQPRDDVALVFVHGIFGDTLGTWSAKSGARFFDLLNQHKAVADKTDLFAFGYTSHMFEGGSFDIQEAANTLYERLKFERVLEYPALVFVAHSMGGLVVLRTLLTRRELLPRVRLIMLYATPQEGSQITTIARHIANNPALEQMLPADRNGFLRQLDSDWKALPERPRVSCAYEKRPTHGVDIVPWSSATRFCDGPAVAIDADHIDITKPQSKNADALVVLVNALNDLVIGEQLTAKLELPDFKESQGKLELTISDPKGKRDVRIVNAGGSELSFTLAEFPDRGLLVAPSPGPQTVEAKETHTLQFALLFGADSSEYNFKLRSDAAPEREVVVRVPDLTAVRSARQATVSKVLAKLETTLQQPGELATLKALPAEASDQGGQRVVDVVADTISADNPDLTEAAKYVLAADLMDEVNWHALSEQALQQAARAEPAITRAPSYGRLLKRAQNLTQVDASTPEPPPAAGEKSSLATPFTRDDSRAAAHKVVDLMRTVPALRTNAISLDADLKAAEGKPREAQKIYEKLPQSASVKQRREAVQ